MLTDPQSVLAWMPAFGDPLLMGWVITAGYLLAALPCLRCVKRRNQLSYAHRARPFGRYWLLVGLLMLLMGVNKQLDVQSAAHELGRWLSEKKAWPGGRESFKIAYFCAIGLVAFAWVVALVMLVGEVFRRAWLSAVGLVVLLGFVIGRAVSMYIVKLPLGESIIGPVRINHVIELSGVLLIAVSAVLNLRGVKSAPKRGSQGHA